MRIRVHLYANAAAALIALASASAGNNGGKIDGGAARFDRGYEKCRGGAASPPAHTIAYVDSRTSTGDACRDADYCGCCHTLIPVQ
jgi:hypothetical protein